MHTTDEPRRDADLAELPAFDLTHLYDDPGDPTELTVFSPDSDHFPTEWVSVDPSVAVPLERVR